MINSVVLQGRLVADPELKTTTTGKEVVTFRLASDRSYADANGERQADFITCVAWNGTATFINRYFAKGSMIIVTGRIQTRTYEDRDGNKRTAFEVVINEASFCGSKNETAAPATPASQLAPVQTQAPTDQPDDYIDDDEDFPF